MDQKVDLTVSIVNHRNRDYLQALLRSIQQHTRAISYEVFVVDNASNDGSVEMVQRHFPDVKLICNEIPNGFAPNHNLVLRQAAGRFVILLNDDMLLLNNALERMVAYLDGNQCIGAAGCKLLRPDGSIQRTSWVGFPSKEALFIELFYLSKLAPSLNWVQAHETTLRNAAEPVDVDHVLGACLMVRSEVIDEVGVLDESFYMFLEETDWCFRIKEAGWKISWLPDGEILHYGQQSVSKDPERFIPMHYENYYRFCKLHAAHAGSLVAVRFVIFAGSLLRALVWSLKSSRDFRSRRLMVSGYLRAAFSAFSYP